MQVLMHTVSTGCIPSCCDISGRVVQGFMYRRPNGCHWTGCLHIKIRWAGLVQGPQWRLVLMAQPPRPPST